VFLLNYKAYKTENVKVLVNGIALKPNEDYYVNPENKHEIVLPQSLNYGSYVSLFYIVGGEDYLKPIISEEYCMGDITELSFVDFIDKTQERLVNARNRQTISDFKGGWYPALLNLYIQYLRRSELDIDHPLLSNGYLYKDLYNFLKKYNTIFHRFVSQMLPTTAILRSGTAIEVRNSLFTQQKFMYRRGVSFNENIDYGGNDGSMFKKQQPIDMNEYWWDDAYYEHSLCDFFEIEIIEENE